MLKLYTHAQKMKIVENIGVKIFAFDFIKKKLVFCLLTGAEIGRVTHEFNLNIK